MKNHTNDLMKQAAVFLFLAAVLAFRTEERFAFDQSDAKANDFVFSLI